MSTIRFFIFIFTQLCYICIIAQYMMIYYDLIINNSCYYKDYVHDLIMIYHLLYSDLSLILSFKEIIFVQSRNTATIINSK